MTATSKKKVCYCCVFQNSSAERQSSESFCTSSCGTQSEWDRKPCRSHAIVYAVKKRMTMAKVSIDVQAVVERLLSLEWHPASCLSNSIPQAKQSPEWYPASCHDPQQSFDHCFFVCWHHRHCLQLEYTRDLYYYAPSSKVMNTRMIRVVEEGDSTFNIASMCCILLLLRYNENIK